MIPQSLKKIIRRDDGSLNPVSLIVIVAIVVSILPLIFAVGFEVFLTYDAITNEPKAAQAQSDLENEFRAIQPLPQAKSINHHAFHKTRHALVGSYYQTNLTYTEIRAYYDSEMAECGWRFQREENVIYDGQYSGGKEAFYSKGQYSAVIQYAGQHEQAIFGWNYSLSLTWELDD